MRPGYRVSKWRSGLPETPCGRGSTWEGSAKIREYLPALVERYGLRTIADVGCGDQQWIKKLALTARVDSFDIHPRNSDVVVFDCVSGVLPEAYDLILCRNLLHHLHPSDAHTALRKFRESGSRLLLTSHMEPCPYDTPFECIEKLDTGKRKGRDTAYAVWRVNE